MSNEFTKLAVRHTVAYSIATGVLLVMVLLAVFRVQPGFGLMAGALFTSANWVIWRAGGVGRRIERDVGEVPVNSKEIVKIAVITVVLTGLVVLVLWLVW